MREISVQELKMILISKGLTPSESEVAILVSKGLTSPEVAKMLFVIEKTIKFHLSNIYKKLKIANRRELIIFIHNLKWVKP